MSMQYPTMKPLPQPDEQRLLGRFAPIALLTLAFAFSACSPKTGTTISNDSLVIFPPPPDTTRIQYLTSISSSEDITGKQSGLVSYVVGKGEGKPIEKPYGIATAPGKIIVCDTKLGKLEIISLRDKSFDYFDPKGLGVLDKPVNAFVDNLGRMYVADVGRKQVIVYDADYHFVTAIGDGQSNKPTDVFVEGGKVWITDTAQHNIHVYSQEDYQLLYSFPELSEDTPGGLYTPTNIYVDGDEVYVSDFGEFKIKVFTKDGAFLRSIGSYGRGSGQFVRPKGIAVDHDKNLFVVDAGFENVQIFNSKDQVLMFFGGPYEGHGNMWLPAKIVIDYDNLSYFKQYVSDQFDLQYLLFVTNQYGPDKVSVYGFVRSRAIQ